VQHILRHLVYFQNKETTDYAHLDFVPLMHQLMAGGDATTSALRLIRSKAKEQNAIIATALHQLQATLSAYQPKDRVVYGIVVEDKLHKNHMKLPYNEQFKSIVGATCYIGMGLPERPDQHFTDVLAFLSNNVCNSFFTTFTILFRSCAKKVDWNKFDKH
jgi:hypothetical protein